MWTAVNMLGQDDLLLDLLFEDVNAPFLMLFPEMLITMKAKDNLMKIKFKEIVVEK